MKSIKKFLREAKKNNLTMLYLWNEYRRFREKIYYKIYSDEEFIIKCFTKKHGFVPNLKTPKSFNEKLNWMKLNYHNDLQTQCVDKYCVREYVKQCGLENILNPLLYVYNNVEDIDYDKLPDKFVLKGAHGSGWNIIVKDKSKLNFQKWKPIMRSWMKQNIYYSGREWPYKNVKPKIVCEKYIDTRGNDLRDYKIFCFNGIPKYIQVDGERFIDHKRAFYDINWVRQDIQLCGYARDYYAEKPKKLDEMLNIARALSKPFPFSRIDLYNVDDRIIFGEITFFPDAAFGKFSPEDVDNQWGNLIELPII